MNRGLIAAVIDDILHQSGVRGVIVGSRILNVFKKKLYTLCYSFLFLLTYLQTKSHQ
jgi:hypothetical protein